MFATPASNVSFAQLVHVSAENAQRRTQTFLSARLGANPTPIRDQSFTIEHGIMELASLLAIAYEAAANVSLRLKKLDVHRVQATMSTPSARQARVSLANEILGIVSAYAICLPEQYSLPADLQPMCVTFAEVITSRRCCCCW
jgi:hypothetical protein